MTTEEVKKIEEILADEEFLKNLSEAKTDDEVKNLMATKGIIMTDQDMADYKKAAAETAEKLSKMSPEELKNVTGGITAKEGAQYGAIGGASVGVLIGSIVGAVSAVNLASFDISELPWVIGIIAGSAALGSAKGSIVGAVGTAIKKQIDKLKNKSKQ